MITVIRYLVPNIILYPLYFISDTFLIGQIAVYSFFCISGYLITKSFITSNNVKIFLWHRFLKIYPALWVAVIVSVILGYLGQNIYSKFGDYSYGLYVYGFPVQQYVIYYFLTRFHHHLGQKKLFLISLIITLTFSACSWHFLESKCLRYKNIFNNKKVNHGV